MDLPDFSDFLSAIDVDAWNKEFEALRSPLIVETDLSDTENLTALINELYKTAVHDSEQVTLLYLRTYHQWLQSVL